MAKKPTADAENDVVPVVYDLTAPEAPAVPTDVPMRLRLIDGALAGDHDDWPKGTTTYENGVRSVPHGGSVWIYGKADPLLAEPGYLTYTLMRAERVYGG